MKQQLTIIATVTIFFLFGCANETDAIVETNKTSRIDTSQSLIGTWTVKQMNIPDCNPCDTAHMTLNKIMMRDLSLNDTLYFNRDSFLFKPIAEMPFKTLYRAKNSRLILYGSDWVYDMDITSMTENTLSLSIGQEYISNVGDTTGPKNLLVDLRRLK